MGSIILYIISFLYVKYWVTIAYSKGGVWESIEPDGDDVFINLCPVINTFVAFICLFKPASKDIAKRRKEKSKVFFKIKK